MINPHAQYNNNADLNPDIPESAGSLCNIERDDLYQVDPQRVISALQNDRVALIEGSYQEEADHILEVIARQCGLLDSLTLQAGFASVQGHRENIGKYFMSVNSRTDYEYITPHSEGNSQTNMQLAAFYCYQNSTDGGVTVLLNIDEQSHALPRLREVRTKVAKGISSPDPVKSANIKSKYQVDLMEDILQDEDEVLCDRLSDDADLEKMNIRLVDVLSPVRKTYSKFLDREIYSYWDSVASYDHDSAKEYQNLLETNSLLIKPPRHIKMGNLNMDNAAARRVWSSAVSYRDIFSRKITYRLNAGDLIIFNNTTWTHSTSNWTPGSGSRKVVAAFA